MSRSDASKIRTVHGQKKDYLVLMHYFSPLSTLGNPSNKTVLLLDTRLHSSFGGLLLLFKPLPIGARNEEVAERSRRSRFLVGSFWHLLAVGSILTRVPDHAEVRHPADWIRPADRTQHSVSEFADQPVEDLWGSRSTRVVGFIPGLERYTRASDVSD